MELERLKKIQSDQDRATHQLQSFYQYVPIGYITLDQKGIVTDWNAAAHQLLDPKRHGLADLPFSLFVAKADVHIFLEHLQKCKRGQAQQVVSELRLKTASETVPVQLLSVPVHSGSTRLFQTALIDLTESRKNQSALEEAREFSDAIVQTTHEPLVVLGPDLSVIRINEAFSRLFRISRKLARGRRFYSMLNLWWAGNELRARLERCLAEGTSLNNFEFSVNPQELGPRTFIVNARPLRQRETSEPLLLVALEDITARKAAEQKLAESNRELQQLNNELERRVEERTKELRASNRELESFCYTIAHDLRAPLRGIAGFGAVLEERCGEKLGAAGTEYVHRIINGAQQMDTLIRDLLEYGRFNTAELPSAPIDAEQVLDSVLGNLEPAINESGATIERKARLPHVVGHTVALQAAFSNLLSNALKFVSPQTPPRVTIWPEESDGRISIYIADNGIGIPPQHQSRIFEIFQRLHTQREYPGTGIGLAIVSKAVQRMGGEIAVHSEPGKGTRFCLNLRRASGARSAALID